MIVRWLSSSVVRTLAGMALVGVAVVCLLGAGGCAQRMAVEGTRDQLFAEAKGALESEGFRTMGAHPSVMSAKGTCRAEGRLQFLYYTDTIAPTIVEVRIEPGPVLASADEDESVSAHPGSHAAGSETGAAAATTARPSGAGAVAATPAPGNSRASSGHGAYSVAISAWSSMTLAPDPWITDLAVGALRRAFLLSGNMR